MATLGSRALRTFLALPLAPSFQADVAPLIEKLKREYPDVRWVRASEIHITLHFFGSIEERKIVEISGAISPITQITKPFEIFLKEIGTFPTPRQPRVIWLGVDGEIEPLKILKASIEKSLHKAGFPTEDRPFKPHLTVGRIKVPVGRIDLTQLDMPATSRKKMNEIVLFQSHLTPEGSHYEALETFPFSTP